ncbi:Conserved_hypothetical protein [Hexamita inflata]|uniref:Uncharacterized protein n=1 Tax=Hexamita inflata TaxID=28002 RepID=A0ABP1HGQ6_9EUKA
MQQKINKYTENQPTNFEEFEMYLKNMLSIYQLTKTSACLISKELLQIKEYLSAEQLTYLKNQCITPFQQYTLLNHAFDNKYIPSQELLTICFHNQNIQHKLFQSNYQIDVQLLVSNNKSKYHSKQVSCLAYKGKLPSSDELLAIFTDFYSNSSIFSKETIIMLMQQNECQRVIKQIIQLLKQYNQEAEIFRLSKIVFTSFKSVNLLYDMISETTIEDELIYLQHALYLTGCKNVSVDKYLRKEHSIITTERIIEIQLANKQELGFHLLKQCSLCQNAARLQKLTKHCVVQDADFVQENFDDLQLMSSYLNAAQLKQMLFWAHSEYTGQFNQLGKCFLEKSDPQNQLEVLEFCVQHAHEHVSLKAGLQSGCAGFAQLTGHLSHALNRPVLFSEIDSRLPSEPVSSTRVRELVNEHPQLMFINLAFISAICSFQPDFDFDLFFQYFLVGAGVCSFVTQRPDDVMISQSEQQYQQVGEFDSVISRCLLNQQYNGKIQIIEQIKDSVNFEFFLNYVYQFVRVFAIICQNSKISELQIEQLSEYVLNIRQISIQEYLFKTLPNLLAKSELFKQILLNKQVFRRRSSNLINIFELITNQNPEIFKFVQNRIHRLINDEEDDLQIVGLIGLFPSLLSINNLIKIIQKLDSEEWYIKNCWNLTLQKFEIFTNKQNQFCSDDLVLELIQIQKLGETGSLVRLILLKNLDYSDNTPFTREALQYFVKQQLKFWEDKQNDKIGLEGYKYEQYTIVSKAILNKIW